MSLIILAVIFYTNRIKFKYILFSNNFIPIGIYSIWSLFPKWITRPGPDKKKGKKL